jgi:hypothetical protein
MKDCPACQVKGAEAYNSLHKVAMEREQPVQVKINVPKTLREKAAESASAFTL